MVTHGERCSEGAWKGFERKDGVDWEEEKVCIYDRKKESAKSTH